MTIGHKSANINQNSTLTPRLPFDEFLQSRPRRRKHGKERNTSPASIDAFESIKGRRVKLYRPILTILSERNPNPEECLTARELLRALIARGDLPPGAERNNVSPRLTELLGAGCVENPLDSDRPYLKRVSNDPPASVWRITARGHLFLAHLMRESQ